MQVAAFTQSVIGTWTVLQNAIGVMCQKAHWITSMNTRNGRGPEP